MTNEAVQECKSLIAQGETKEVLSKLMNTKHNFHDELIMLNNRWLNLKKEKILGTTKEEMFELERNKINHSILEVLKLMEHELYPNISSITRTNQLIHTPKKSENLITSTIAPFIICMTLVAVVFFIGESILIKSIVFMALLFMGIVLIYIKVLAQTRNTP